MEYKHGMLCPACTKGKLLITLDPLEFKYRGHEQIFEGYESFKCDLCPESFLSKKYSSEIEMILRVLRNEIDEKSDDVSDDISKVVWTITRLETDDVKPN